MGLVGSTGSGKTTLVRLLMRFHDPDSGGILLDGNHLTDLKLDSLRSSISLVSQNTTLFPGSVLDNIRYGKPDASIESAREAANIAEATEFIDILPNGWHTEIGEEGIVYLGAKGRE